MKKNISLILIISLLAGLLTGCGGGGRADEKYVGKWISVAGEAFGVTLTGEDMEGYALELKKDGKATLIFNNESQSAKWTNDDTSITLKTGGTEIAGTLGEDLIIFDDMLGSGMKVTFAKEGTDATKPENYLPESEKKMLGTWQSHSVTDILGDPVDELNGDELKMVFSADHTVQIILGGEDTFTTKWSLLGDSWGSVDDENIDISWDVTDEGISVNYSPGDDYYIFMCKKQ